MKYRTQEEIIKYAKKLAKKEWKEYKVMVHLDLDFEFNVTAPNKSNAIGQAKGMAKYSGIKLNRELTFLGKWTGKIKNNI